MLLFFEQTQVQNKKKLILSTLLLIPLIFLPINFLFALESNYFTSPRSKVYLISENKVIQPGEEFWLALKFEQQPKWHIYWQNPGDSGLPAKLEWEEHPEVTFDTTIYWERPDVLPVGHLVNYGFSREVVLLPIKAFLKKDFVGKEIEIKLGADWLICKIDCVPESNTFVLKIPVGKKVLSDTSEDFANSIKRQPLDQKHQGSFKKDNSEIEITIDKLPKIIGRPYLVFKEPSLSQNIFPQTFINNTLNLKIAPENKSLPSTLNALILDLNSENISTEAYELTLQETNGELKSATVTNSSPTSTSSPKIETNFLTIILFALLGGIILNLMPCVFPVISIKVLDFIDYASQDRKIARRHSMAFAAGIIIFMLGLAIIAEIFKSLGENLGWGFQLQSPIFVSGLIILFYLLGLSFAGYFYVGNKIVNKTASIKTKKTYLGSFLNGALATLVATPCTAPFMGTALGATLNLNFFSSLLVFISLGVGISLPFILFTFNQRLMDLMPRPGAWMEKLKEFMSFLMFLTSLWLLWVLISLTSSEYLISVLLALILITLAIWINKNFSFQNAYLKLLKIILIIILLISALSPIVFFSIYSEKPTQNNQSDQPYYGLDFKNFSEEVLKSEISAGRVVYIDFTARWCITCQVNKKRVFSSKAVRDFFEKNNVSLLVADWTNKNSEIKESLNFYGRNSVPLNIIYGNNPKNEDYRILPALLSANEVLKHLNELTLMENKK